MYVIQLLQPISRRRRVSFSISSLPMETQTPDRLRLCLHIDTVRTSFLPKSFTHPAERILDDRNSRTHIYKHTETQLIVSLYASVEELAKVAPPTADHSAPHRTEQDATKNPRKENPPSEQLDLDMIIEPEIVPVRAPIRRWPRGTVSLN